MAYLDSHGLGTLWAKIKGVFGASLSAPNHSATSIDIQLMNKADTPTSLSTLTIPAAGTNGKAGVMTNDQATKLAGIAAGAQVNVKPDWDAAAGSAAEILNKPVIPEGSVLYQGGGQNTDGAIAQKWVTDQLALKGSYSKPSGGIPAGDLAESYYLASNPNGYTANTGTITGITMNGSSKGTSGVVNLGTVLTEHQDISGKANKSTTLSGYGITNAYTKTEVDAAISTAVTGNAKYKGTLASEAAFTGLTNYKQGNYWVVSTGWTSTSKGITLDAGNMIFANADGSSFAAAKFDVIQADIEAIPDSEINGLS